MASHLHPLLTVSSVSFLVLIFCTATQGRKQVGLNQKHGRDLLWTWSSSSDSAQDSQSGSFNESNSGPTPTNADASSNDYGQSSPSADDGYGSTDSNTSEDFGSRLDRYPPPPVTEKSKARLWPASLAGSPLAAPLGRVDSPAGRPPPNLPSNSYGRTSNYSGSENEVGNSSRSPDSDVDQTNGDSSWTGDSAGNTTGSEAQNADASGDSNVPSGDSSPSSTDEMPPAKDFSNDFPSADKSTPEETSSSTGPQTVAAPGRVGGGKGGSWFLWLLVFLVVSTTVAFAVFKYSSLLYGNGGWRQLGDVELSHYRSESTQSLIH